MIMRSVKILLLGVLLVFVSCKKDDFSKELQEAAANSNKLGPQMMSDGIRLDSVSASKDKVFKYNYTLTEDEKTNVSPELLEGFKKEAREEALNVIKTSEEMKTFRDNDVTLKYSYVDKNGQPLTEFEIKPADYKQK